MKKKVNIRVLLALTLMGSGLAFLLAVLHAALIGSYIGNYDLEQFYLFLRATGLIPWMVLNGLLYIGGLTLLVYCVKENSNTA